MSRILIIALGLGLLAGFTSCDFSASADEDNTEESSEMAGGTEDGTRTITDEDRDKATTMQEKPEPTTASGKNSMTISTAYAGMQPGDAIGMHEGRLKKTVMRNGKGTFDVYAIMDENGRQIGYSHPNFEDDELLGDIVITSPDARTTDGFRIGTTYGDLRKKYPNIEVHGSEIEGRVHAIQDHLYYRLDTYNNKYNLDPDSIDDGVKVTEITLSNSGVRN